MRLKDKVILLTGSIAGDGMARTSVREHAQVAIWAWRRKKLKNQPGIQSSLNTGKHI